MLDKHQLLDSWRELKSICVLSVDFLEFSADKHNNTTFSRDLIDALGFESTSDYRIPILQAQHLLRKRVNSSTIAYVKKLLESADNLLEQTDSADLVSIEKERSYIKNLREKIESIKPSWLRNIIS